MRVVSCHFLHKHTCSRKSLEKKHSKIRKAKASALFNFVCFAGWRDLFVYLTVVFQMYVKKGRNSLHIFENNRQLYSVLSVKCKYVRIGRIAFKFDKVGHRLPV